MPKPNPKRKKTSSHTGKTTRQKEQYRNAVRDFPVTETAASYSCMSQVNTVDPTNSINIQGDAQPIETPDKRHKDETMRTWVTWVIGTIIGLVVFIVYAAMYVTENRGRIEKVGAIENAHYSELDRGIKANTELIKDASTELSRRVEKVDSKIDSVKSMVIQNKEEVVKELRSVGKK